MFARQKILAFLKKQNIATATEIGTALRMTSANVRHHLSLLERDGRVEVIHLRGVAKRGRPQKVYRLGSALLGDNLAYLADALLGQISPEQMESTLEALGRALAGTLPERSAPLMRRLALTVERLNAMRYQARWEAHLRGPRLVLGHCPYAAIIEGHPELCRMDAVLLQTLLGVGVEQIAKLEQTEMGNIYCIFRLSG
ncbi:MAG: HTH domain-containing protein [Anaerolineales bacterium]